MLLKGMRERAQSLGKREWTDEEIISKIILTILEIGQTV